MKNFSLLLAMLFLAFTVEAQTSDKSKRDSKRKATNTSVQKSDNSSKKKAKVLKQSSSSRSSSSKSSNSALRSSSNRNSKATKVSPVSRTANTGQRSSSAVSSSANRQETSRSQNNSRVSASNRTNSSANSRTDQKRSSNGIDSRSSSMNRSESAARVSNTKPANSTKSISERKLYSRNTGTLVHRKAPPVSHHKQYTLDYRRTHYPFVKPHYNELYWNANMYRNYSRWYPDFKFWYYQNGYRIHTISAYDSYNYIGEVARVYGRISEVWYSEQTREYYMYIGGQYPYQDFTIVLNAMDAKRYSWDPVRYFTNRNLTVTGLVSLFESKPEMLIRKRSQISLY